MNSSVIYNRNGSVDFFRGIAIVFVVLGHTLSNTVTDYQSSFLYNVIWTLQMPLFMLISGYVTRYSQKIASFFSLMKYIFKRTLTYLFPWVVWTVLIRGIIFHNIKFLNFYWLVNNMDSGYWFLTSLWTICVIVAISSFLSSLIYKNDNIVVSTLLSLLFVGLGAGCLLALGCYTGMSFLGLKFSLYYLPFYYLGALFGKLEDRLDKKEWYGRTKAICSVLALLLYAFLLNRFSFYEMEDNVLETLLRFVVSICGCCALLGLGSSILTPSVQSRISVKIITYLGRHTLEIYLVHYLVLAPVREMIIPEFNSLKGVLCVVINFIITIIVSVIVSAMINSNKFAQKVFLGRGIVV